MRFALRWLFAKPGRLRFIAKLLRLDQAAGFSEAISSFLPQHLRELRAQQPKICDKFSFDLIRETESPRTARRYRVGLLMGCVQDVAYSDVNRDTVDVLLANGCEVFTPRTQSCCGSLMGHNGELELARKLARQNLDAFPLEYTRRDHRQQRRLRFLHETLPAFAARTIPAPNFGTRKSTTFTNGW